MAAPPARRGVRRIPHVSAPAPLPTIAVTSGEPAGIGPEICRALTRRRWRARLVVIGDTGLFGARLPAFDPGAPARRRVEALHRPLARAARPGRLDTRNAAYVLGLIDAAIAGCTSGLFDAMVTAPVHKALINDAGIDFSGHTEYLAERTGAAQPVMLLVGGGLRVALATTHLPLAQVSGALTRRRLAAVLRVLDGDLRRRFGLRSPRILVCGLNPHAGESGHLGREELEVIAPVVRRLRRAGMNLTGPAPADTAFVPEGLAPGRRSARDVSRPGFAGDQARELRARGQRDPRSADRAHLGRSWHGARHRGPRTSRSRQPARGGRHLPSSSPPAADGHGLEPAEETLRTAFSPRPRHDRPDRARDRPAARRPAGGDRPRPRSDQRGAARGRRCARRHRDRPRRDTGAHRGAARAAASCGCTWPMRSSSISGRCAARAAKLRLAGNLPYNVSTPLLFRLIEQIDAIADMHFMLQKEVVARMAARPGTRDYGRLTVMLAPHVRVRPLFDIGTGAFSPPPRVQSTYFALEPLAEPPFALGDRDCLCPRRRRGLFAAPQDAAQLPPRPGRRDGDRVRRHRPRRPARDARPRRIRRPRRTLPVLSRERVVARPAHHIIRPSGLPGRPCANIRRSCSAWT